MIRSIDEKMEEARSYFTDQAEHARPKDQRATFERLADMAASIQETQRMLDYLKIRVDEIQHEMGLHSVGLRVEPEGH